MKRTAIVGALILFGFLVGLLTEKYQNKVPHEEVRVDTDEQDLVESFENYPLINPLLSCGDTELSHLTNKVANDIEDKVTAYIESKKQQGDLVDAAVYYKDLNGGPWALVNRDLHSLPGSLLKVPVVMSVYKKAEENPGLLTTPLEASVADMDIALQDIKPEKAVVTGESYKVEELINLTLQYSDNTATRVLTHVLSNDDFRASFDKLGIASPDPTEGGYTLTVRAYASFFRILFNSSYLSREYSEKMLEVLTGSVFNDGLVAGVPTGTKVAHKFGERNLDDGSVQLHDCGIIYDGDKPYILCVMTHGRDFKQLGLIISAISKTVFEIIHSS